jgi:SAM-dependent methyltransferase
MERYDTRHAPAYDEKWGAISPTHRRFLDRFLGMVRTGGTILDAACGTGKYWPAILGSRHSIVGTDQSAGMLEVARSKHPQVPTGCVSLQDLEFDAAFDGVMCVDALEFVGPEDWPVVLSVLTAAVRGDGPLYLTVELADPEEVRVSYERAHAAGHPVVPGEDFDESGYHFYPERNEVRGWLARAGLEALDEDEDDDYWHILLRRQAMA